MSSLLVLQIEPDTHGCYTYDICVVILKIICCLKYSQRWKTHLLFQLSQKLLVLASSATVKSCTFQSLGGNKGALARTRAIPPLRPCYWLVYSYCIRCCEIIQQLVQTFKIRSTIHKIKNLQCIIRNENVHVLLLLGIFFLQCSLVMRWYWLILRWDW